MEGRSAADDDYEELKKLLDQDLIYVEQPGPEDVNRLLTSHAMVGPIRKSLTDTDVDKKHRRLELPRDQTEQVFLPELVEGTERLGNKVNRVPVKVYHDIEGSYHYMMTFTTRNITTPFPTHIVGGRGWLEFLERHSLKCRDVVMLRMFRDPQNNDVCFFLSFERSNPRPALTFVSSED